MKKLFNLFLFLIFAGSLAHAGSFSGAVDPTARQAAAAAQSTANTALANYNPASVAITGGTISGTSGGFTTLSASSTVSGAGFSTYLASPPAIGGTAAASGAFTTLSASSTVSGAGFSTYLASPPAIGGTAPGNGTFANLAANTTIKLTAKVLIDASAPTILSGFGTSPSITGSNGSAAYVVNVGAGGTASTGIVGMPTASNGWNCSFNEGTTAADRVTRQTAFTQNTVSVGRFVVSTNAGAAWSAGTSLYAICFAL